MSSVSVESLRAEIQKHGPPRRGRGFPLELRLSVGEFAVARRALGDSVTRLARELGMEVETLRRWVPMAPGAPPFRPVSVASSRSAQNGLVLVHEPSGIRIEGLDFDGAVELLRRLG